MSNQLPITSNETIEIAGLEFVLPLEEQNVSSTTDPHSSKNQVTVLFDEEEFIELEEQTPNTDIFNEFEIEEVLGEGGMGIVYLASKNFQSEMLP